MPRIRAIAAAALLVAALPTLPALAGQAPVGGEVIRVQGYYHGGGYGRPYRVGPRHYAPPPRAYYAPPRAYYAPPRAYYAPQPRYRGPAPYGYYGRPPGGYYRRY